MNWETLYCPNPECTCYGYHFYQGTMVKNGSVRGRKRALCKACGNNVALNYATAYYGLEGDSAIFEMAVRALAEGNSLRSTARIVAVDKATILAQPYLVWDLTRQPELVWSI
jgi:transposase-like protein